MNNKRILITGEPEYWEMINIGTLETSPLIFDDFAPDLTSFMEKLSINNYYGVLIQSLAMTGGEESPKYENAMRKFSEFDHSPYIWYSTGLLAVQKSVEKGLVCVVDGFVDIHDKEVLDEAKALGAIIVPRSSNIRSIYNAFLRSNNQ